MQHPSVQEFLSLESPQYKYIWLLEKGKKQGLSSPSNQNYIIPGCPSDTYFWGTIRHERYDIYAGSQSYIMAGIISVMIDIYHEQKRTEVSIGWHKDMELDRLITYQRWIAVDYMATSLEGLA